MKSLEREETGNREGRWEGKRRWEREGGREERAEPVAG